MNRIPAGSRAVGVDAHTTADQEIGAAFGCLGGRFMQLYSTEGIFLLASLRFLWNATRGYRFRPWRSEYLRWRIETYSGQKAETLTGKKVFSFLWSSRWELLEFLGWTDRLQREVRKRV